MNENVEPPQESPRVEDVPRQMLTQATYTVQVKIMFIIRKLYCFLVNGLIIFRRTNPIDKTATKSDISLLNSKFYINIYTIIYKGK